MVKINDARIELTRGQSGLIAEGTADRPIVFTSVVDDRYGGSGVFDTSGNGASVGARGDWAGIILNHSSHASIDHALIAFAGGDAPIEGVADNFDAIEVHQARLRLANSIVENNAAGGSATSRSGRGSVPQATIYVRGAQPILVNNVIQNNSARAISINANSLTAVANPDPGRSTGKLDQFGQFADNLGPLVRLNRLRNNAINGMEVRGETLTTESVWDDTDITHVLQSEIIVGNHHTYSGLRLQSSNSESLVVKLNGATAGFTATGSGLDIDDRIGGTVQILGSVGHPVILTSLHDDTVGAGFTPQGVPILDTNNNGTATTPAAGNWRSVLLDRFSNDRNVEIVREAENVFTNANDVNWIPTAAQFLGVLAADKRDANDTTELRNQKGGDENSRLGFEVHGYISPDDPTDVDVYSFSRHRRHPGLDRHRPHRSVARYRARTDQRLGNPAGPFDRHAGVAGIDRRSRPVRPIRCRSPWNRCWAAIGTARIGSTAGWRSSCRASPARRAPISCASAALRRPATSIP